MKKTAACLIAVLMICAFGTNALAQTNEILVKYINGQSFVLLHWSSARIYIFNDLIISRSNNKAIASMNNIPITINGRVTRAQDCSVFNYYTLRDGDAYFILDTLNDEEAELISSTQNYWSYFNPGEIQELRTMSQHYQPWEVFGNVTYTLKTWRYQNGTLNHLPTKTTSFPWFPVGIILCSVALLLMNNEKILMWMPVALGLLLIDVNIFDFYNQVGLLGAIAAPFICFITGFLFGRLLTIFNKEYTALLLLTICIIAAPMIFYGFTWYVLLIISAIAIKTYSLFKEVAATE